MNGTQQLRAMLADLPSFDRDSADAVRSRSERVLRPPGALRRLDDVAVHVAGWHATDRPAIDRPTILVFAADHGVSAAGVSAYPSDITAAMLAAVRAGRATINAIADQIGATVHAHDVGVGDPTGDIRTEPALSDDRFASTVERAVAAVDEVAAAGADLVVLGELGIGNTTAAAALGATVVGGDPREWVGRGAGVDDDGFTRKRAAVVAAATRVGHVADPIELLRQVGGAELLAMAAACVQARRRRIPVVLDGFLAGAASLPLQSARDDVLAHCLAGHRSGEAAHRRMLEHLGLEPLLDLGLRLGEGSGAAAAVPLIRLACASVAEVATFDEWFGS